MSKLHKDREKKHRRNVLRTWLLFIGGIALILYWIGSWGGGSCSSTSIVSKGPHLEKLAPALSYLEEMEEVLWVRYDKNTVHVCFIHPLPHHYREICREAARRGNEAIDFGCHVWAFKEGKDLYDYSVDGYEYNVTFRYGKEDL